MFGYETEVERGGGVDVFFYSFSESIREKSVSVWKKNAKCFLSYFPACLVAIINFILW